MFTKLPNTSYPIVYTILPAYGRDYKSQKALLKDWHDNKDFLLIEGLDSTYINKQDAIDFGLTELKARYADQRKVMMIEVTK